MNKTCLLLAANLFLAGLAVPSWSQGFDTSPQELIRELNLEESDVAVRELPFWRKPKRIYIVAPGYDEETDAMMIESAREVVGDVDVVEVVYPLSDEVIAEAEVLVGRCTPRIIQEAKNLRWLQDSRHGVDSCIVPGIEEKQFLLTNTQHTSGPPIADHAIAMMTMLTRGLHLFHRYQLQGEWKERPIEFPVLELSGKTLLVVGLGGVGTEVARRAHGLGMRVLGLRNSSREGPEFVEYVGLSHELYELAAKADVIVNALPLTRETEGIFDEKFFNSVKHGTYFIAVGRGETTVTGDLVAALKDGRVTAAGLDVTDPEPLPQGHELWSLPNVIITPHISATTDEGRWRRWVLIRENLRRYVNGEKLLNVVDVRRGY